MTRNTVFLASAALAFGVGLSAGAYADDLEAGRSLFNEQSEPACAVCHTLADAQAEGEVGPDLDDFKPTLEQVQTAVTSGIGVMPAYDESMTAEQIEIISRYVSSVAGAKDAAEPAAQPAATESAITVAGDVKAGEKLFKKCRACHTVDKGGSNRTGPNLFGIVGGPVAGVEAYKYSAAMKAYGGVWSPERLAAFLAKPRAEVPKTKMSFGGLKKEKDKADMIAYLATLRD